MLATCRWMQLECPAFPWLQLVVVWWGKLFRKTCPLSFRFCVQQPRALILLACSSVLSFVLYFESCFFFFVWFFMFHADCFYFWLLHACNRPRTHLTVKNSFLNLFILFLFSGKTVLCTAVQQGLCSNSYWILTESHLLRVHNWKTWCLCFKLLQRFNLALIDGCLHEGCNERCTVSFLLHVPSAAIPLLPGAGCSWPCRQGLHFSSPFSGVFQDQTPSPEVLQPLIFLHDFQHWVLLWVLGGQGAMGPPGRPPHPTARAQSRSCPTADLGDFSFSLVFGLRPSPCAALHSHTAKEKEL